MKKLKSNKAGFIVLLILLLISKFLILKNFGFKFTGSDDMIFWRAVLDFSSGVFHEPYFYGQNYNVLLESLVAVPFYKLGLPIYKAISIATVLVSTFPFVLFSFILYQKKQVISSYLFLLIPIGMSIEYDMLTTMARGFANGIFFCSFLICCILEPKKKRSYIILGLAVSFGYYVNPSSLLFSFPVCLYLLFSNYKKLSFYIISILSVVPALIIKYLSDKFYLDRPDYAIHSMMKLDFSWERFFNDFLNLDQFYNYLTPIYWKGNWIVLIIILLLGILITRKNVKKGVSILATTLFLLALMGVRKVNIEIDSIFFSSVRIFLAVPMIFGLALMWFNEEYPIRLKRVKPIFICIGLTMLLVKDSVYSNTLKEHTTKTNYDVVAIKKISKLKEQCEVVNNLVDQYQADLVIYIYGGEFNGPEIEFYNYGCSLLKEGKRNKSVMNIFERRYWVFEEERKSVRNRVLIFNRLNDNFDKLNESNKVKVVHEKPLVLLIEDNDKSVEELAEIADFNYGRPY